MADLPDYHLYVIPAPAIPEALTGEVLCDHRKIKGVALKSPTIASSLPASIENPAIAYNAATNRFRVDIESSIDLNAVITSDWTRQLGKVDLDRVLGATLAHTNPVIARLSDGVSAFIDPRDVSDRAARLLGKVYGSQAQVLQQKASTYELLTDPTDRAARLLGIIYGSQAQQLQQKASTYELLVEAQNLAKWGGTTLTGRDISGDLAYLQRIPSDPSREGGKLTDIATYLATIVKLHPKGTYKEKISNINLSAGTNVIDASTVPSGEIWKVTSIAYMYLGTVTNVDIELMIYDGGSLFEFMGRYTDPVSANYYTWDGEVWLKAGDRIRAYVYNATAGDDFYFVPKGVKYNA